MTFNTPASASASSTMSTIMAAWSRNSGETFRLTSRVIRRPVGVVARPAAVAASTPAADAMATFEAVLMFFLPPGDDEDAEPEVERWFDERRLRDLLVDMLVPLNSGDAPYSRVKGSFSEYAGSRRLILRRVPEVLP
jgi:hypothetical protein